MLRFLLVAFLITCLSGVVYFNILVVPEGHVGLLKERTQGWDDKPLESGYHWVSTAFIPRKWKLHLVDLKPPLIRIDFKAPLRYTEYLELSNIFRTQIEMKIQYRLDQKKIYHLLHSLNENFDTLDEYIKEKIMILLKLKKFELYRSDADIPILKIKFTEYIRSKESPASFSSDWEKVFGSDGIELLKCDLLKVYVPDLVLYQAQLRDLDQLLKARRRALVKNLEADSKAYALKTRNKVALEKARAVLELIGKDPRIIDYLKYQELNPQTSVIRIESRKKNPSDPYGLPGIQNEAEGPGAAPGKSPSNPESGSSSEVGNIPPITR